MRFLFVLLISLLSAFNSWSQTTVHKPLPKAKQLLDSAASLYLRSNGNADSLKKIIAILDAAIKVDKKYYEPWTNKMSIQCQLDKYSDALKTIKQMESIFPDVDDLHFYYGIIQYVNGRKKEAAITFNNLLQLYERRLAKLKKGPQYKQVLINKGIVLVLLDKTREGKTLLNKIYDEEKDMYTKSYIGFYINSSKEEIINDRVPGK